jgi:hypothetical protein
VALSGPPEGLDKKGAAIKMEKYFAVRMSNICNHDQIELIARRDGVDYVRCQGCGQIFESEDLEAVPVLDEDEE